MKKIFDFNYTGKTIEFEFPYECMCKLECWGAAGATRNAPGGKGGYACGKYKFKAHQKIQINVKYSPIYPILFITTGHLSGVLVFYPYTRVSLNPVFMGV